MNDKVFIGIDVSKEKLDYHISNNDESGQLQNTTKDIKEFLDKLTSRFTGEIIILCEATGGYEQDFAKLCYAGGLTIIVIQPIQIRSFAKALKIRAKTDKIDAWVLSRYCKEYHADIHKYVYSEQTSELRKVTRRRLQLVNQRTAASNRMDKVGKKDLIYPSFEAELKLYATEIAALEKKMRELIMSSPELKRRYDLLRTIAGVALITSCNIISEVPEILELTPKQLNAMAGLAPMNQDSGKYRGKRKIEGGRKYLRSSLYMAAVTAIRYNKDLKAFYQKLRSQGKLYKVAITAIARKLLLIARAVLLRNSPWVQDSDQLKAM